MKQGLAQSHKRLAHRVPYRIVRKIITFNVVEYAVVNVLGLPKWVAVLVLFILI